MIRRTAKFLLEAFGAILAGLVLLLGFLAYRLTHEGPIHLRFLVPYLEEAINGPDQNFQVSIDDAVLTWAGWQRTIDVRSLDLHVRDRRGRELATIPEASISISARALMRGIVAPSRIEVFGASLRLWRSRDNRLMFGAQQIGGQQISGQGDNSDNSAPNEESDNQSAIFARVLADMLAPPDLARQTGYLVGVAIIDGKLVVVDRGTHTTWHADQVQVSVIRDTEGLDGTISLTSPDFGQPASLTGHFTLLRSEQKVVIDTQAADIDVSKLGLLMPRIIGLQKTDMRLNGRLKTEFGLDGKIGPAHFEMSGGPGLVDLDGKTKKPIPIQSLSLDGSLDANRDTLSIYDITADIGGPQLHVTGAIDGLLTGTATDGSTTKIALNLTGTKIDAALLDDYWPSGVADNTRAWVVPNVPAGKIDNLQLDLHMRLAATPTDKPLVEMSGSMQTSGLTVHYLRPLPPITNGVANATFTEKQFAADIKSGAVGAINLNGGKLLITGLDQEDQLISVGGDLASPLRDALVLLDNPRLGYPTKLGLKPQSSSGDVTAHLQFDFPAAKDLSFAQVKLGVQAQLTNVGLKTAMFGQDVTEGKLALKLNQDGMTIAGPAKLAGIPLDVNWIENFTDKGPFDEQIHAVGTATADQRALLGYDYRPQVDGPGKADLTFTRYADKTGTLDANFDLTDTTLAVDFLKWRKVAGKTATAKMLLKLQGDKALSIPHFEVAAASDNAQGSITFKPTGGVDQVNIKNATYGRTQISDVVAKFVGNRIDVTVGAGKIDVEPYMSSSTTSPAKDQATLDKEENTPQRPFTVKAKNLATARIAEGRELTDVTVELSHDPMWWDIIDVSGKLPGGAPLTFVYRPTGSGTHQLLAKTSDGGAALKVLNIYDSIKGGNLTVSGTVKDDAPHRPLRGKIDATSYRLVKTPFFARFLTVASLTGLVDVLTGEGFFFDGASAKFTKTRGVIDIAKFRSAGPSIGLTASGTIDLDRDQINVKGTLVPAYAFNSILGNIPVIGNILQGGEGQGLFAATYQISGPLAEPKINVNPWSALAPGFLRGLFSGTDDETDEPTTNKIPSPTDNKNRNTK